MSESFFFRLQFIREKNRFLGHVTVLIFVQAPLLFFSIRAFEVGEKEVRRGLEESKVLVKSPV